MRILTNTISYIASTFTGSSPTTDPYNFDRPVVQRKIQTQRTIVLLVVGRSGSGKTSLINAVYSAHPSGVAPHHQSTTLASSYHVELSETKYKLIDTPGFDNVDMNDITAFTRIADYFWAEKRYNLGVNGVIYIHQAGDPLRSRSLRRYLTVLSRIFLRGVGMPRLTIFIPYVDPQGLHATLIDKELRDENSALSEASSLGATIISGGLDSFVKTIKTYKSTRPIVLPIQDYNPNLASELESILREKSRQPSRDQDARLRGYQQKCEELRSALETKERDFEKYQDAYHRLENLHANQQDTEVMLRRQLQQIQREYASLRSELQLQENYEQSDIVQELEDLNRQIDDISREISAYLVDNHARAVFEREPADVTALEARHLPELLKLLGYDKTKCSLVSSEKGDGLDIEGFLDFAIRDLLCGLLARAIFDPFHPAIDTEQSDTLWSAYEDIQKRESQTRSGKWRSSTFKSVYKGDNPDQVATFITELLHRFTRQYLNPLLQSVFGTRDATMGRQHYNQMHDLVKRAWDWNAKLKGEVVVLGDFRPTLYTTYTNFDPDTMKDFESKPNSKPTSVLGMVGLGLVSLRAVGGGQPPEETLVCKATVTTDTLYA